MAVPSPKTKRALWILVAALLIAASAGYHHFCYAGEPYGEVFWSPNRKFKVVKDQTWTLRSIVRKIRGQGWGAPEGYVRVRDASGRKVREEFMSVFEDVRPVWNHREVYFYGRGPSWPLPADSEL